MRFLPCLSERVKPVPLRGRQVPAFFEQVGIDHDVADKEHVEAFIRPPRIIRILHFPAGRLRDGAQGGKQCFNRHHRGWDWWRLADNARGAATEGPPEGRFIRIVKTHTPSVSLFLTIA
jgi:hypothetical protein